MSKRLWARTMWSHLAHGRPEDWPPHVRDWVQHMARRMLDADSLEKNDRTAGILAATDLTGTVDNEIQDRLWAIVCYGEKYPEASPQNPPLRDYLCEVLGWDEISDETADRRIRSAIESVPLSARAQYEEIVARAGKKARRRN